MFSSNESELFFDNAKRIVAAEEEILLLSWTKEINWFHRLFIKSKFTNTIVYTNINNDLVAATLFYLSLTLLKLFFGRVF